MTNEVDKPNRDSPANPVTAGNSVYATGLTKRELFAMAAMQGIAANQYSWQETDEGELANIAVEMADALLEELAK